MDEWLVALAFEQGTMGFTRAGRRRKCCSLIGIALVVTGWSLLASEPVAASPIKRSHHRDQASIEERDVTRSWSAYLLAGPKLWSSTIHPSVTADVRTSIWHALRTDAVESNPWVRFLLWKQSLNPARFARNHPHVAPVLDRIRAEKVIPDVAPPPPPSPPSITPPVTEPQTITPAVPEPGPWLLALGMTGWGLWWRGRQR
jgi:hypothetical protein